MRGTGDGPALTGAGLQHVRLPGRVARHIHHYAPLESPWIWRGLLLVTIGVLALLIVRAVRRRRRGQRRPALRRWTIRSVAVVSVLGLVLVTGLAWLNSYVGYLPTVASLQDAVLGGSAVPGAQSIAMLRHGSPTLRRDLRAGDSAVISMRIPAPGLDIPPRTAFAYLPPGYGAPANAHRRYPVVYLIAGFPGRPADWMLAGGAPQVMNALIARRQVGPMIVVAPDADGGFQHDSECLNQVGGPQIASYLTGTVVHYVDRHLRTLRGRDGRAIGGMSSGGYCALNLGLRHQNEYSTIVGFEPYGTPGRSILQPLLHGDEALYRANSPSYYLPSMHFSHPVSAFLDAGGASAGEVARVRPLARELAARGQDVVFRAEPGQGHTWKEAAAGLPYGLYFAAHHLTGGLAPTTTRPGRTIVTIGHPRADQADPFIQRYARQEARCRLLGPGYRPVGGAHSLRCARAVAHP